MKNLIIIGARGFGREVYNSAIESIGYNIDFIIKGFLDDKSDALDGYKDYPAIIDSVENYSVQTDDIFISALGDVKYKRHYSEIILNKGGNFTTLIHKGAYLSKNTFLGKGCIILAGVRVHCDVKIGNFVTIQPYAIIGHDVIIEDWSHINALADCGGFSRIGNSVTLHTTSFVLPKVIVEDNATVGAGSVVLNKVKAGTTVFGVPAKIVLVPN